MSPLEEKVTTAMAHTQKVKAQLKHDAEYWRTTLETYAGRVVVWRILELCGVFGDCGSTDHADMAAFLGKRRIGLRIMSEIHLHHEKSYQLMEQEELERQYKASSIKGETNE